MLVKNQLIRAVLTTAMSISSTIAQLEKMIDIISQFEGFLSVADTYIKMITVSHEFVKKLFRSFVMQDC